LEQLLDAEKRGHGCKIYGLGGGIIFKLLLVATVWASFSCVHKLILTYTVQKRQCVRLVPRMQRKSILDVTDTISIASFLADFHALSMSASLEYIEFAGMLLLLLIAYSSDADADNA
jgi:hypothetical protein